MARITSIHPQGDHSHGNRNPEINYRNHRFSCLPVRVINPGVIGRDQDGLWRFVFSGRWCGTRDHGSWKSSRSRSGKETVDPNEGYCDPEVRGMSGMRQEDENSENTYPESPWFTAKRIL